MGHLRVQFAITFGFIDAKYSDGAILALNEAMGMIFQPDWIEHMIDRDFITGSIRRITDSVNQ
jgi:hypothetical protein